MNNLNKDILLGIAIGDALGLPIQFLDREVVAKNPVTTMVGFRQFDVPAGTWSDDSSLSLCLAESLCNGYDLNDIANNFIKWMFEGYWTPFNKAFDIGKTTYFAIVNLRNGTSPHLAGMDRERDNGNGSLMRILPLVPYILKMEEEEKFKIIREVSSLTHRHPRSILACISLCEFAIQYIDSQSIEKAYQAMQQIILQLLKKEMLVALLNGLVWGVIAGLCGWGLYHDSSQGMMLGGVMALAMLLNIVLGAAMGLAVPLVLKALNKDPAMGGSVLLTFMTDSGGFLIFLGLASVFFQ